MIYLVIASEFSCDGLRLDKIVWRTHNYTEAIGKWQKFKGVTTKNTHNEMDRPVYNAVNLVSIDPDTLEIVQHN